MKLITWNINGTKDFEKVRDMLVSFRKLGVKVLLLQEVHRLDDDKQLMRWCREAGWKVLIRGLYTNSGGLAVLSADEDIDLISCDPERRWMLVQIGQRKFLNIYAPSENVQSRCNWFDKIKNEDWAGSICGGDWNTKLSVADAERGKKVRDDGVRLQVLMKKFFWLDAFSIVGEGSRWTFTHRSGGSKHRIDYWFVPTSLADSMISAKTLAVAWSDHWPLLLEFNNDDAKKGHDIWRLNRRILSNDWCSFLDQFIQEKNVKSVDEWNFLKLQIKQFAIAEEKRLVEEEEHEMKSLEEELQYLKEFGSVMETKAKMKEIREKKKFLSSNRLKHWTSKWKIEGERVGKVLMRRVKAARSRSVIKSIWNEKKEELVDQQARDFIASWYANLYGQKKKNTEQNQKMEEIWKRRIRKFKVKVQHSCSQFEILERIVRKLKREKSPGEDGLPGELYQRCPSLVESLWRVWSSDKDKWLSGTGVISLLHKKQDKRSIENWRPISLLNVDHKLLAAMVNNTLKWIASKVVGRFQHGFIPGRRIHDAILKIKAAQYWCQIRNNGGILCIDFWKAYDSVFRQWIWITMEQLGLSESIIRRCQILAEQGRSMVLVNGFLSESFPLLRGVRQGCPLSPSLFAFATVGLEAWAKETQIGLKIGDQIWQMEMMADDLTAFIGSLNDIQRWIIALEEWREISGLMIANDKCSLWSPIWTSVSFKSVEVERILGVYLTKNNLQRSEKTKELIEGLTSKSLSWSIFSSLSGKVAIWNSLIGGKLNYVRQWLECSSEEMESLDKVARLFLCGPRWKFKNFLLRSRSEGGAGLKLPSQVIEEWMARFCQLILSQDSQEMKIWQMIIQDWSMSKLKRGEWKKQLVNKLNEFQKSGSLVESQIVEGHIIQRRKWPAPKVQDHSRAQFWKGLRSDRNLNPFEKDFARWWIGDCLPELPWIKQCFSCHNQLQSGKHFKSCPQVQSQMIARFGKFKFKEFIFRMEKGYKWLIKPEMIQFLRSIWKVYVKTRVESQMIEVDK